MRIARTLVGLLALGVLALAAPAVGQAPAPALLIRGATLIDGLADAPLRDRSLLIEGNVIRDILPADAAVPAGAQAIDLPGKFIIPGLFDSHVHWEEYMGELYINHGVTSVVSLDNVPKALRARSEAAHDLPRFFHPGGRLVLPEGASELEIRQMVRNWLQTEPDFFWFSQYNAHNARSYAIAADEAHRAGLVIFGHTDDAPGSVRDGMDIIEHIWGFGEALMSPDEMRAFRNGEFATWATFLVASSKLDGLIAEAVRRGAALNPTLQYEWGGMSKKAIERELEDYSLFSNPDLSYIPRNVVDGILGRQRQIKNFSVRYENTPWIARLSTEDRKDMEAGYRNVLAFTAKYVAAGGKVHAGTDTIAGGVPGLSIHHEMEILVEAGLSPMQALKAATSWPAELLEGKNGARGRAKIGALRSGNVADLVVVSADPTTDISNTKKIERVMKDGRWVELGYHPEYFTQTRPARPIVASYVAPTISAIAPSRVVEGAPSTRVVLEGSGFATTSLVRLDGVSVKTIFRSPKRLEFDLPASAITRASPDGFSPPGPSQDVGIIGNRSVAIHVFNPPPDGGTSNTVYELIVPK
jgi:imidazolonepropionase-like amidohydrolase